MLFIFFYSQDAEKFYNQVPIKLGIFKVEDEKFNHFDFLWALDAPELVYSKVVDVMTQLGNSVV